MAVFDDWRSGNTFTADDEDAVAQAINGSGWLAPCRYATTGSETFTISSGNVTQIAGTALDGGSPAVGDRILVKDAPTASGTGSALSSHPGNGVYVVTANATNLALTRAYEMSNSPPDPYVPSAFVVSVMGGAASGGLGFIVTSPNSPATFTYGSGNIQWAPLGFMIGTGLLLTGSTLSLSTTAQTNLALAATSLQNATGVLTTSGTSAVVAPMNTGQVILGAGGVPSIATVSGDISLGSTGTATIATGAVTVAKMANLAAHSLLGNTTGSSAAPAAVSVASAATAAAVALRDANADLFASSFIAGTATTVTAGGTTTLTAASGQFQQFTGTATQAVVLPDATTLSAGQQYQVTNRSTATVTVEANGGSTLQTLIAGSQAVLTLVSNGSSAGTWDVSYTISGLTGTVSAVSVVSTNGFAGTSSGGSTPALTLTTTVTGVLKGNGTAIVAAAAGTDYAPATTGSSILKANGSGGFSSAASGTDYAPATSGTAALKGNGSGGFANATLNDVGTPTANFAMGSNTLTGLPTPTASDQAAPKSYVDALFQGASGKYSAEAATTGAETFTIVSGSVTQISGTAVDGTSPSVGDYVLVKDAPAASGTGSANSTQPGNGLYQVTSNTTNLTLTRATALSGSNGPVGAYVFISGGTANGSGGWIVTTPSTTASFTYGTNNIKWTQFTGLGEITPGAGLAKSGNTISLENGGVLTVAHGGTGVATLTGLVKGNGTGAFTAAASGTDYAPATTGSSILKASAGGFANAVSGTDYAPATSGSALLKGNGSGGFSSATSGTDYAPPTSGTNVLKGNGSGGFANASFSDLATPTSSFGMGGYGITGAANPTAAQDLATKVYVDSVSYHPWCRAATTGVETFTLSGGTVTQISGTSLDGLSPSVGDRILIKDAPATSGTGSVLSNQSGNGIYIVTANATNLVLSRTSDMSSTSPAGTPVGSAVIVVAGSANASTSWKVSSPSNSAAFTYGSSTMQWTPDINTGNVLLRSGNTIQVSSMSTGQAIIGNAGTPSIATLTGDVTVGATGATAIATSAVTLAKLANLAANSVIGNTSGSSATPAAVSLLSTATAGAVALRDSNANLAANAFINSTATTATANGGTTLTVGSAPFQQFTGTLSQSVNLPNATTLVNGQEYFVANRSTGLVTVFANGGGTLQMLAANTMGIFTLISNSGSAGTWDISYVGGSATTVPYDFSIMQSSPWTPRSSSTYGDNPFGVKLQRACTLTSVTYRCYTADVSGSLVVSVTRNGTPIAASTTTISSVSQVAGVTTSFSQACSAGDIIDIYVSAVGTTPGNGLVADITGNL